MYLNYYLRKILNDLNQNVNRTSDKAVVLFLMPSFVSHLLISLCSVKCCVLKFEVTLNIDFMWEVTAKDACLCMLEDEAA